MNQLLKNLILIKRFLSHKSIIRCNIFALIIAKELIFIQNHNLLQYIVNHDSSLKQSHYIGECEMEIRHLTQLKYQCHYLNIIPLAMENQI